MSSKGSGGNGRRLAAQETFEILGPIRSIQPIATGSSIRDLERLRKAYGAGRWRKMNGVASIRLSSGRIWLAESHWYAAHGIGKKEIKRKRYLKSGSEL